MINSLKIATLKFPYNIVQGPLAGISCAPFRSLVSRYGKPAFTYTEMISAKALLHRRENLITRYLAKDKNEGPVCFQISGTDVYEISEATKIVTSSGADLIDLNCGCPVKKIRQKGAGSKLLTDSSKLLKLIEAMKTNTSLPVSIKIRVQSIYDNFNHDLVEVIKDSGADFITVHGRHWTEKYDTPCHYDEIKFFVNELKIPVIGNGDVADIESLKKMLMTKCAGVMIARAGVGQPWLTQQLIAEFENKTFIKPILEEIGDMFFEHIVKLVELLKNEKFAILQARKFAKYYARSVLDKDKFCEEINNCETLSSLDLITKKYFNN